MGLRSADITQLRHEADKAAADLPGLLVLAERAAQSVLTGGHLQRKPGTGERFWQYREYDIADRPQDIDWRQTAKGDQIYVRQKEKQNAQTVAFWCQSGADMVFSSAPGHLPQKSSCARILTLALAIMATHSHEKVSLLGGDVPPGRTEKTIQLLGEALINKEQITLEDIHFLHLPPKSSLVLIGDFLAPPEKTYALFKALARQSDSAALIQILDPAEIDLPYDGRVIFESPDKTQRERIDNVADIRQRYRARIARHIKELQKQCGELGWTHRLHRTDQDIRTTLFEIWQDMAPIPYAQTSAQTTGQADTSAGTSAGTSADTSKETLATQPGGEKS